MRKVAVPAAAVLAASAILQASLSGALSVHGVRPSLIFIAVYALAVRSGEMRGMIYGAVGGLVEDCLSGGLLGLMLSGNAIAGYLAGRLGSRVFNIGEVANFAGIFLLSLVQGAYTAATVVTLISGGELGVALLHNALPQAVMNALVGTAILWPVEGDEFRPRPLSWLTRRVELNI